MYVALTCGRNEERYIESTVRSVLGQDPPPLVYLFVDDGSTDATVSIVAKYPQVRVLKLKNPRHGTRGVNLAWALNAGIRWLRENVVGWEYLLKVDADSVIPPDYFRRLLEKFKENPRLGVASGNPTDERVWRGRASDGAKVYRRACLDDIGWFTPGNAFDTLALIQAKQHGWVVESYPDLLYVQLRTWRRVKLSRWVLSGRSRYYLGFPVWHTFLVSLVYVGHRPWILGGLSMFLAHLLTALGKPKRPHGQDYYLFASRYAMWELLERIRERRLT